MAIMEWKPPTYFEFQFKYKLFDIIIIITAKKYFLRVGDTSLRINKSQTLFEWSYT